MIGTMFVNRMFLVNTLCAADDVMTSTRCYHLYPDRAWIGYSNPDDLTYKTHTTDGRKPFVEALIKVTPQGENCQLTWQTVVDGTPTRGTVTVTPQPKYGQLKREIKRLMKVGEQS